LELDHARSKKCSITQNFVINNIANLPLLEFNAAITEISAWRPASIDRSINTMFRNALETLIGVLVSSVALWFVVFA